MVTRRVSEDLLATTKSSLTRRVTISLLRFAVKVSGIGASPDLFVSSIRETGAIAQTAQNLDDLRTLVTNLLRSTSPSPSYNSIDQTVQPNGRTQMSSSYLTNWTAPETANFFNAATIVASLVLALAATSITWADDTADEDQTELSRLKLKTERVVVFKDGFCLVVKQATATTDEIGNVFTDDVPDAASLGSFWAVAEKNTIKTTTAGWVDTEKETDQEISCTSVIEIVKSNLGKECSFQFEEETIKGKLLKILTNEKPKDEDQASSSDRASLSAVDFSSCAITAASEPSTTVTRSSVTGKYFVIRTTEGDKMILASSVKNLTISDMNSVISQKVTTKSRHKRLSMKFDKPNTEIKMSLMYFRPDVRWIPTYRVNLTDQQVAAKEVDSEQEVPRFKKAEIILQGEIINEAEDFTDVPFHVVVGVPNFRFKSVPSPMVLESAMRNVLRQAAPSILGNRENGFSNSVSNVLYRQSAGNFQSNAAINSDAPGSIQFPQELDGKAGNDLYVYELPPMTLKQGERAMVPILKASTQYRDIYTWDIDLVHSESYAATSADSPSPLTLNESKVWRQIELLNQTKIPWTTGAAMLVEGEQPLAQELLTYTSPGGVCRVPVTVSIDLRGKADDTEVSRNYKDLVWRGRSYARVKGKVQSKLTNNKTVAVPVEVRLRLGGKAVKASNEGKITVEAFRKEDWRDNQGDPINNSSSIQWTAKIKPGESFETDVDYEFLLRQ